MRMQINNNDIIVPRLCFSSPAAAVGTNNCELTTFSTLNCQRWRSPISGRLYYRHKTSVLYLNTLFVSATPLKAPPAFGGSKLLTNAPAESLPVRLIGTGAYCSALNIFKPSKKMTNDLPLKALGISTAATLGVLLRLAVNRLFGQGVGGITSGTSALFVDLPANFLGCFILGVHESMKNSFSYPDWFSLAISTGLAGSVTSPRLDAFVAIPIGVAMAFLGLTLGKDFGDFLLHVLEKRGPAHVSSSEEGVLQAAGQTRRTTSRAMQICVLLAAVLVFIGLYGAMVAGAIFDGNTFFVSDRRFFWMCGVFAPFGALLRWWLSCFNGRAKKFPLGTFAANMTAMVVDLSIAVILHIDRDISVAASFVLVAVVSGLGGSLSTVSTWVNEATKLKRVWRYVYVLGTISAALILGLIMFGTAVWVS